MFSSIVHERNPRKVLRSVGNSVDITAAQAAICKHLVYGTVRI